MKFPLVRLAAVAAVGTVALLAQAGMTSTAAAVPNSAALPTGPSGAHTSVTHAVATTTKSRTSKAPTASHSAVTTAKVAHGTTIPAAAKCDGVTDNTAAIQAAVNAAGKVQGGAVVTIPAGVCAVFGRIPVTGQNGVTIQGAGQTRTFIVQHASSNIFQITSPGNTVEDMNLDTYTYNPGVVPIPKSPVPAVLFSNANNTTVLNVTAETGSGFGLRLTGPKPCYTFGISGTVVTNLIVVNHGTGGFAALDIDCQNGARLTNINIHGGILALFNDTNTVLLNETYFGVNRCQPAWFVTGPASNILIQNVVTYAGAGVIKSSRHGAATGITVVNQTFGTALHC
jgi:hypothetical protein